MKCIRMSFAHFSLFSAAVILYSRKIQQGIKFGGLVVMVETAKLKFANTILHAVHNDVMHAVALLALSGTPVRELYM